MKEIVKRSLKIFVEMCYEPYILALTPVVFEYISLRKSLISFRKKQFPPKIAVIDARYFN